MICDFGIVVTVGWVEYIKNQPKTPIAIKYIWKRFSDLYFDEKTQNVVEEFSKVRKRLAHRTEKYVDLNMNTLKSMQHLENEFPWVRWNVEK